MLNVEATNSLAETTRRISYIVPEFACVASCALQALVVDEDRIILSKPWIRPQEYVVTFPGDRLSARGGIA
jgi:hypothetical protein